MLSFLCAALSQHISKLLEVGPDPERAYELPALDKPFSVPHWPRAVSIAQQSSIVNTLFGPEP